MIIEAGLIQITYRARSIYTSLTGDRSLLGFVRLCMLIYCSSFAVIAVEAAYAARYSSVGINLALIVGMILFAAPRLFEEARHADAHPNDPPLWPRPDWMRGAMVVMVIAGGCIFVYSISRHDWVSALAWVLTFGVALAFYAVFTNQPKGKTLKDYFKAREVVTA